MKLSCLGFVHFPFFCSFDSMMVKCDADAFHFLFFLSFEKQKTSWAVNPMDHYIANYPLWAFLQSHFAYHNVTVWKKKNLVTIFSSRISAVATALPVLHSFVGLPVKWFLTWNCHSNCQIILTMRCSLFGFMFVVVSELELSLFDGSFYTD